jgi:hypothetical protein
MRKFLLMAIAGLALAFAAPSGASAMTISPDVIKAAAEGISPEAQVAWHCRSWSGWCRSHRWRRHYHWRRHHHWRRHYHHRRHHYHRRHR